MALTSTMFILNLSNDIISKHDGRRQGSTPCRASMRDILQIFKTNYLTQMEIVNYSEKAIAVIGETRPHSDALKGMGGRFNRYLKCGAGWIFSQKKRAEVEAFIAKTGASEPADKGMASYIDAQLEAGYNK